MIGLDTNILLRIWLNDDPAQNERIDALLAAHGNKPGTLLVSDVVLAEALWTLRTRFNQDAAAQLLAVRSLLNESAFAFEDREAIAAAAALFEQAACGFVDCLVAGKHARLGCDFTATFDRRMSKLPSVKII